jgi:hypothetical protein
LSQFGRFHSRVVIGLVVAGTPGRRLLVGLFRKACRR